MFAQQIAQLGLELVWNSLQYETEKNNHPQPVSTAKAGTVEQRERSEEGTAESDKGSKSKLPLASCGVYQQGTFFVIASQREQQRVATLHKEQEHQQSTQ